MKKRNNMEQGTDGDKFKAMDDAELKDISGGGDWYLPSPPPYVCGDCGGVVSRKPMDPNTLTNCPYCGSTNIYIRKW